MRDTENSDPNKLNYRKNEIALQKKLRNILLFYLIVFMISDVCLHLGIMAYFIMPLLILIILQLYFGVKLFKKLITTMEH